MNRPSSSSSARSRWPARPVGLLPLAYVLIGVLGLPLPYPATASTLPEVTVSFVHDAPEFFFPMDEIQVLAEEETVRQLGETFGFLRWLPSGQSDSPAAEWVVKLRQEEAGSGLRIWLEHHARVDGLEFELRQKREHTILYELGNVIPSQSPSRLRDRVQRKLEEQLNEDFLNTVEKDLLRRIELTDDIRAETEADGVVVPLRLSDLKATTETRIGVRLKINNLHYGMFVVKAASQVFDGELTGCVRGWIEEFEVPPIGDFEPDWWHDSLPEVMSRAETKEVYMHDYDLDPGAGASTSGGLVTDPGD